MILELNQRIVLRRTGEVGLLCDPDRKYATSLNRTGIDIYLLLQKYNDSEVVLEQFSGGDPEKRQDAENFLLMLSQSGYLAGYAPSAGAADIPLQSMDAEPYKLGVGNSMHGTFDTGDRLELRKYSPAKLRKGDVISFTNRYGQEVAHRIVGGRTGRWVTMGDNNSSIDRRMVTLEQNPRLVTGKFHHGKYYPIARGSAGMRHFYFVRFKRQLSIIIRAVLRSPVQLFIKCCFWRKEPDRRTTFGKIIQYSRGGKVIGWKVNGKNIYVRNILRLTCRLP